MNGGYLPGVLTGSAILPSPPVAETIGPIFDGQSSVSIGAIAVAPSDADVLRTGTGEAYDARRPATIDTGKMWWMLVGGRPC
jgi:hypothetical protein